MQYETVKVLWEYDKKNSLTNALLLWVLITGILRNKKIFEETHSDSKDDLRDLEK